MLSQLQLSILNACADDDELFYFLFAEVNYGGQVFAKSCRAEGGHAQYEDDRDYTISHPAADIVKEIRELAAGGLLACWRIRGYKVSPVDTQEEDFSAYEGYDCLLFEDHMHKYGYGPHVFKATEKGIAEMLRFP